MLWYIEYDFILQWHEHNWMNLHRVNIGKHGWRWDAYEEKGSLRQRVKRGKALWSLTKDRAQGWPSSHLQIRADIMNLSEGIIRGHPNMHTHKVSSQYMKAPQWWGTLNIESGKKYGNGLGVKVAWHAHLWIGTQYQISAWTDWLGIH